MKHGRELGLCADVVTLTAALVDIASESRHETRIADFVEKVLWHSTHLEVNRDGNCVVARTRLGRSERVLVGGHLDTVPSSGNMPHRISGGRLYGLGSCDMKGGVAVALRAAGLVKNPSRDVTYVFYDCEEIEATANGLGRIAGRHPDWLTADFAVLMEPTSAEVEAGCQGTLRAEVSVSGKRAHSARSWLGENAVHGAHEVLRRLREYRPRRVSVDGLEYREGLAAVGIGGGVAGNVIPDRCTVTVNYRFAPTVSPGEAVAHVREVFEGFSVDIVDLAPGALPGLDLPPARGFLAAVGGEARPKFGWTDVSRFSEFGVPAVNYGPGDPVVAHSAEEFVDLEQLRSCEQRILRWLGG